MATDDGQKKPRSPAPTPAATPGRPRPGARKGAEPANAPFSASSNGPSNGPANDPDKKRVNTRGRKPPEIVRPQSQTPPTPKPASAPFDRKPGGGNLFVGGPRNEFGTRIAKRITCSRCGNDDHVPHAPRDASKAMCRACAALMLRAYEVGVKAPVDTRPETCNLCGVPFRMPMAVPDDGDPLCPNCLRGFTTWQGGVDTPYQERQNRTLEQRKPGVVVRKKNLDGG